MFEHDLVDAAHQPRRRLRDADHVREQREAFELDLRDVGLQQHVGLGRRLVDALLDGDGNALDKARQLLFLLLAHRDVGEILGWGAEPQQLGLQDLARGATRGIRGHVRAPNLPRGQEEVQGRRRLPRGL